MTVEIRERVGLSVKAPFPIAARDVAILSIETIRCLPPEVIACP